MHSINIEALSAMLKSKRGIRGLREVSKEISEEIGLVSVSTLSRVENGNIPDIDTYLKICKWLEVPMDFFSTASDKEGSAKQKVVANLRADKTLPTEIAEALIKMVNLAYANVKV